MGAEAGAGVAGEAAPKRTPAGAAEISRKSAL